MKITKLTAEQEASIPEFRAQWIALGESTFRATPIEMREAVNALYDSIGQARVPVFVMDSPLGCVVAANVFRDNIWDNIRDNIGANIGANIWDNIRDQHRGQHRGQHQGQHLGQHLGQHRGQQNGL